MNPQDQFIQTVNPLDYPLRNESNPQQDFAQTIQDNPVPRLMQNKDNVTNLLKRYDVMWGDMSNPSQPVMDVNFPQDIHKIYTDIFQHKETPRNLHHAVGELREALRGALTEQHMTEEGQHIRE